jgi:hypothetical protein
MTLADLLTALTTRGVLPGAANKKTSLRYLADALGYPSLEACPVDDACRHEATWRAALETYFQTLTAKGRTISAGTRSNTRNNLRVVFRLAEAHGLLQTPLPSTLLPRPALREAWRRQQRATAPYKPVYRDHRGKSYWLPQREWSPELQEGWRTYRVACGGRIRETSFQSYVRLLETYWGYVLHIRGRTPTWDDVFNKTELTEFVSWHAARVGRSTVHARQVVIVAAAMANVLQRPERQALAAYRQGLKKPAPLHNKRVQWVSLKTLEEVADACLAEGRAPLVPAGKEASFPGKQRAGRFQRGVILKLLVRVPLRQRNVREMQLGKNLFKDPTTGHWHLEFAGDELKIGNRGPQVNKYELDLTAYRKEFIPILEEWLTEHRPKLPNATTSPFVFLTQRGNPHIQKTLHGDLADAVAMRTGKRFYPHLIRTIWATEYLQKKQDFQTAATMLGDQLQTVIKTYYDVVHKEQIPKASDFMDETLKR